MVIFIVGQHTGKIIQRVMKINASTKSLVERLCDFKIFAISVLSFIGSVCAPDKTTLKAENHALQCTTAGPYNAIPSNLLEVGIGPDLVGIHSISLAARYRVAACSSTLRRGPEKVNEARGHTCTPLCALSPAWELEFLLPSMAFKTANAFDIITRLDRNDTLDDVPQDKKQNAATGLLPDKLRTQDFAGPLACRASRFVGPISRHRVADMLPRMKRVSRACPVLDCLLASFASYVMGCVLNGDFTLQRTITLAVLDAQMNLIPSHITMRVPGCITSFILETCYGIDTKKLLVTRLDHQGVPAEPSTWYCGSWRP